jgi:very-short-patch-repair endonuclease
MLNEKIDQETYELYTQVPQGSYRIDLTVKNKKTGNYILAIECDGFLYHKINMDQKERDFYRQNYLEERG